MKLLAQHKAMQQPRPSNQYQSPAKRLLAVIGGLSSLVVVLLAACAAPTPPQGALDTTAVFEQDALAELPRAKTYRIGIQTEVTGSGAQIGDLSVRAARLAVEEINAGGGVDGIPVELIVRDCRSDLAEALRQYRDAVASDGLVALLGPVKSAYAVPMVREHLNDGVPLFIGATNTTLTEQGDQNLFQMRPSIRVTAAAMVALAVEGLETSRAGVIFDTDLHGSNGAERVSTELRARGREPVVEIGYTTATADYDPIAQEIAAAKLDTLFIYGTNPTDIGQLLRAVRYRAPEVKIVTSPGGSSVITHNLAGDAQDGVYVAIDSLFSATPDGMRFEAAFRKRFGLAPDTYAAWYYDAVHLIAATLHENQSATLSRAIRASAYTGAQGQYRFNSQGEGLHEVALALMRRGEPAPIGRYGEHGLSMYSDVPED